MVISLRLQESGVCVHISGEDWYVCDLLYAVLYVRVSCFVVRGCAEKCQQPFHTKISMAKEIMGGGIARFTRVLFELRCYPQFELEIHIVEVSYFTNILYYLYYTYVTTMCIYCDYCVYHYKSTELVSLYTLDIGL